MGQCPQCGSEAASDPERPGALWCLSCWHVWTLPRDTHCPGRLPRLNASLRKLAEYRDRRH
ncbi:hypothetical protein ABZ468_26050 [Streptomyces sp. NPDC005708]|uniref:hypothetical protein n=1 Tax=Streptomyces sp. NPDC005708 TaxID=3154564 RepID=UPI0033FBA362